MNKLWFVALAMLCIHAAMADGFVDAIAASGEVVDRPRHHVRTLVDSSASNGSVDSEAHEPTTAASSSRPQAAKTTAPSELSRMTNTWFFVGLWIVGVCVVTMCFCLAMTMQPKRNSIGDDPLAKPRRISVTCCGEDHQCDTASNTKNATCLDSPAGSNWNYSNNHINHFEVAANQLPKAHNTVINRFSELSSVCSLADSNSDSNNDKSTGIDDASSLEYSLLDESALDEVEMYSMLTISFTDDTRSTIVGRNDGMMVK